jgi:hypothetical protein
VEKIESDYNAKGLRYHFEFDPKTRIMSIYGPESTWYAHRGDLMLQLSAPDWWSGFEQARQYIDKAKTVRK